MAITAPHVPAGIAVAPVIKKRKRAELTGKITVLSDEALDESEACGSDHGPAAAGTKHPAAAVPSSTAHAPSPAVQLLLQGVVLAQSASQHKDQATAATDGGTQDCCKVPVSQEPAPLVDQDVCKKVRGQCSAPSYIITTQTQEMQASSKFHCKNLTCGPSKQHNFQDRTKKLTFLI